MAEIPHKKRMTRQERKAEKIASAAAAQSEDVYSDGWRIRFHGSDSGRHFSCDSTRDGNVITYNFDYVVDETRAGSWADSCCGKMILDAKTGDIIEYYEDNDGYISPEEVRAYVAPRGRTRKSFLSKSWGYDDELEIWFKIE